jgi:hypothetical protein
MTADDDSVVMLEKIRAQKAKTERAVSKIRLLTGRLAHAVSPLPTAT